MRRMNGVFAVLVTAAMITFVSSARATGPVGYVVASGSSAEWQTIALAAYGVGGKCTPGAGAKLTPPCFHWTSSGNLNLVDTRPTLVPSSRGGPGPAVNDSGATWVVWDSASPPHFYVFEKVDSVVGVRCYFANPSCQIQAPAGFNYTAGNDISSALWGSDSALPTSLQTVLNAGIHVNTAATDIRPEDAEFAECRVNSKVGNGSPGFGDGLDGLGYNSGNASGICPTGSSTLSQLVGSAILSGYPGSTASANVLAFNISGTDPFSGLKVPGSTTIDVGADAIVFVFSRNQTSGGGGLNGLSNVTDTELQSLFSGGDCDGHSVFGVGTAPNPVYAYLREPLSGTYNTTEATVMRRPVETIGGNKVIGKGMETGVGSNNPLKGLPCGVGGFRSRGIGTGEVVKSVKNSVANNGVDGMTYAFFSFGNVSSIAGSSSYGYVTLDGVDPIAIPGTVNQQLPTCSVPCSESSLWGAGNNSFPKLRSGTYSAWSLLRMVTTGSTNVTNLKALVNGSHTFVVNDIPDYVPATAQPPGCTTNCTDPGLVVFRAHYQQCNGNGTSATCPGKNAIGGAAGNGTFATGSHPNPTGGDTGGDMGGCIESTPLTKTQDVGIIQIGLNGGSLGESCSSSAVRK